MALAAVAAAMLVPAGQAALSSEGSGTTGEYVPFVTDFPKPQAAPVPADPTDAPTAPSPAPKASTSGIDWGDVGIGTGVGAVLAVLLAGSWRVLTRRAGPARS